MMAVASLRNTRAIVAVGLVGVLLAIGWVGWSGTGYAQEPSAEPELVVTATWSPPAATVGDRLVLNVRVRHADDVLVTVERPSIPRAEVVGDTQPVSEIQNDGFVITTYAFQFQAFTMQPLETGLLTVRWLRDDGTTGAIRVPGVALTVVSVRGPGDEALRPLKPQALIGGGPPTWVRPVAMGAAVVAVLGLIAGGIVWWRRRPGEADAVGPVAVAEASARQRLDALRGLRLDDADAFQHYYGEIAVVVRRYLGERFEFNASALTTAELERRMTAHGIDRWQARLVGGLLDRCDHAVYARQYPEPASADHDLTLAYEIVELSRPRPVALQTEREAAS